MAITNQERAGKAMDLLRAGLAPFVEREIPSAAHPAERSVDPASAIDRSFGLRPQDDTEKPLSS